jgi:mitotic-spindle organizing protein 1
MDPSTSQETMEILYEISKILNTGLDRSTLSTLVGLCESGVNPEALAAVVKELRREGQALEVCAPLFSSTPSFNAVELSSEQERTIFLSAVLSRRPTRRCNHPCPRPRFDSVQ